MEGILRDMDLVEKISLDIMEPDWRKNLLLQYKVLLKKLRTTHHRFQTEFSTVDGVLIHLNEQHFQSSQKFFQVYSSSFQG